MTATLDCTARPCCGMTVDTVTRSLVVLMGLAYFAAACAAKSGTPAEASGQGGANRAPPDLARQLESDLPALVGPDLAPEPAVVLHVTQEMQDWVAASIRPPYREFPNVILYHREDGAERWIRVEEGLLLGLQPDRSGLLDLHTQGKAFDIVVDGSPELTPEIIDKVDTVARSSGLLTVAYLGFVHHHSQGAERYFIDKTDYLRLGNELFDGRYSRLPRDSCTSYDTPAIGSLSLTRDGEQVVLVAETDNGQTWRVSWTGADSRGRLVGKAIQVSRRG